MRKHSSIRKERDLDTAKTSWYTVEYSAMIIGRQSEGSIIRGFVNQKWVPYSQRYLFNAIPDTNHNANPTNVNTRYRIIEPSNYRYITPPMTDRSNRVKRKGPGWRMSAAVAESRRASLVTLTTLDRLTISGHPMTSSTRSAHRSTLRCSPACINYVNEFTGRQWFLTAPSDILRS